MLDLKLTDGVMPIPVEPPSFQFERHPYALDCHQNSRHFQYSQCIYSIFIIATNVDEILIKNSYSYWCDKINRVMFCLCTLLCLVYVL